MGNPRPPLAPTASYDKVSGCKDPKNQGSGSRRPHHRGTRMFTVSMEAPTAQPGGAKSACSARGAEVGRLRRAEIFGARPPLNMEKQPLFGGI